MKTLKLIVLMLIISNLAIAQTVNHGNESGDGGLNNAHYGAYAGKLVTGENNVFIGALAGRDAKHTNNNVGIGFGALYKSGKTENDHGRGLNNMAIGHSAGFNTDEGINNIFMGAYAGTGNESGSNNVYIGNTAGKNNTNGHGNIAIGRAAGNSTTSGNYNVFIGYKAGNNTALNNASNQLYIQNSNDIETPLIYGDFFQDKVGIGTSDVPDEYTLAVKGHIVAEELTLSVYQDNGDGSGWPDYVFAEDYDLMSLTELEAEIEKLGHLPGVPSAEEVEENGHALGQMDAILLEKIEELTLHLIDINNEVKELRERNQVLETRLIEAEDK